MLRALWNIFEALRAPREDLSESVPPAPGISTPAAPPALANGTSLQPNHREGLLALRCNNATLSIGLATKILSGQGVCIGGCLFCGYNNEVGTLCRRLRHGGPASQASKGQLDSVSV